MHYFQKTHVVQAKEIDQYHHVNNVVYVQWIQDVADLHWQELIVNIVDPKYVWFVVRHEIDYKGQAKLGDSVTIKTWVGKTEGVTSIRHVEISRGETVLVSSQTTYCFIDGTTQKPKRITNEIRNLLLPKQS
ncbi:thioesterase family protein [Tenacibaculum sp. SG-28]|uniref:acyl-CoA thioesterase n=1 Tax=Tenacibaculum sp. SG-28 TaxID=754426 RepID=UPI000CF50C32|nr:thioesterase family protein [Tenacibaculum sp. SG-28]PQJ23130.1 thioesterase [Tenacibaculum sp. SG-28]